MTMELEDYTRRWNALSWKIDEAVTVHHAATAWFDKMNSFVASGVKAGTVTEPRSIWAFLIFSHSLDTHFFVSMCRIRETTNSTYSLPELVTLARDLKLLDLNDLQRADELLAATKGVFEKLKKARGMASAHLNSPDSHAFKILTEQGVRRADVAQYLHQCSELYQLLGKPLGKQGRVDIDHSKAVITSEIGHLFSHLWPHKE